MSKKKNKDFIDPVTTSVLCGFVFKSVSQAVVGWIGLNFFKNILNRFNCKDGKPNDHRVSQEKSAEKN